MFAPCVHPVNFFFFFAKKRFGASTDKNRMQPIAFVFFALPPG
jgi:hypothetical protein